ncbi:MAG: hypothetical protein PHQ32_02390 [Firmicutes bacterium]|nr:hypothetical protein [Bacillota bacterium]
MDLNEIEKSLIVKAHQDKQVVEMSGIRNAFYHAYMSANKKNYNKPLYKKRNKVEVSQEEIIEVKNKILEIDKQDPNKEWIKLISQNSKGKGGK